MTPFRSAAVPLVDLAWQHEQISHDVIPAMREVMRSGAFIHGPDVAAFELEFAEWCGVEHCVGVASGTDALELVLRAIGVGRGSSVIVPTNTFVGTAEAVERAGARPVLVDCDHYGLIDVERVAAALEHDTRAVIPVHLYGQIANMEPLSALLDGRHVAIIEDAAQAHGAVRKGHGIGSWGIAAGTSFYPGKNLGAYGDAGAVLTSDDDLAGKVRSIADHGAVTKYRHERLGYNSRLDTLQAVVLRAKLAYLQEWNRLRRQAAFRYHLLLEPLSRTGRLRLPEVVPGNTHVWHLYVVRVSDRDAVLRRLHEAGVGAGVHYPVPVHLQPAFSHLGYQRGDFPVAETAASEVLSLPIYPGITEPVQDRVVEAVFRAVESQ